MTSHTGPTLAQRDGLTVIGCRACGFAHLAPIPPAQDDYYRERFWAEKSQDWRRVYEAQRDYLSMRSGDWLSVIAEHAPGRALLDVGCGWGDFLAAAEGWRGAGLELSAECADYCRLRGLSVSGCSWADWHTPDVYDAITALWLLEHLPNPRAFLEWAAFYLAPGGVLALAVPNEFNAELARANATARVKDWFVAPTHTNYFTPASLGNLLGRAGFRVVDTLTTWPMETFISGGWDYTADEALGAKCHAEVRRHELGQTREQRLADARARARAAVGRDLFVVAVKEGQ